jgi:hypothetical protein
MRALAPFLLLLAVAAPAFAQEPPRLVLGAGATGFVRHNGHVRNTEAIFSAEYRSAAELAYRLKPLAGAFATGDGSAYVHAGLYRDFDLSSRWIVTPHFSAGFYDRGSKNDLGYGLEFQSGVDLFYRMARGMRIGATLRHVSNAGLADINPGIETFALLVALPVP